MGSLRIQYFNTYIIYISHTTLQYLKYIAVWKYYINVKINIKHYIELSNLTIENSPNNYKMLLNFLICRSYDINIIKFR